MVQSEGTLCLAILNDYQNVAKNIFSPLEPRAENSTFVETLHAHRDDEKTALISRLTSFDIISTIRERNALPVDLIAALPDLQLILTVGIFNSLTAVSTCTAKGILVVGTSG